jgi:hypothetical protein
MSTDEEKETAQEIISRLQRENTELRRQRERQAEREQARLRDLRRRSIGLPSTSTPVPATSAMTDPVVASLTSPPRRIRSSTQRVVIQSPRLDEEEDDDDGDNAGEVDNAADEMSADEERRREQIVSRAMTKMPKPERFAGKTEEDKAKVKHWCRRITRYLNGVFRGVDAQAERMQFVLGLLDEPASDWMEDVYSEEQGHSWEQLMPHFIQYIEGGRDQRSVWKQRLESLTYGRGRCRDLLSFNHEFDTLRVKLCPSSTGHHEMNVRSGEDYGAAIKRGDHLLFAEILRILGPDNQEPELSTWKQAAATAIRIRDITREATRNQEGSGGRGYPSFPRAAAHNIQSAQVRDGGEQAETWERQEGEEDAAAVALQHATAAASRQNRQGGQSTGAASSESPSRPSFLSEDEMTRLRAAGKCFRCFTKGHRARDQNCPARNKPRRKPTAEDLKF